MFRVRSFFCGRTGSVGGALPPTSKERILNIQKSAKPRMHVIDLVDNCGKHEASRPSGMPAVLSGQAAGTVVVRPPLQQLIVVVDAACVVILFLRGNLTQLLVQGASAAWRQIMDDPVACDMEADHG